MSNEGGYIKLWRDIHGDGWYQSLTDKQKLAWIHLLTMVNWKPSEFGCSRCGKVFDLPAGATAKSQETLAGSIGCGVQVLKGLLRKAIDNGTIECKSQPRCHSIYVVVNWDKYQGDNPGVTHRQPTDVPRDNLGLTAEEEGKKDQEGKKHSTRAQGALFASPSGTEGEPAPKAKKKPKSKPEKRQPWQQLLDVYHDAFLAAHGQRPLIDWAKSDRTKAQAILKGPPARTVEELVPLVRRYVTMDDDWAREQGYPFAGFGSKINKLMVGRRGGRKRAPVVLAERFDD